MKMKQLFTLAILALLTASCNSKDSEPRQEQNAFTLNISGDFEALEYDGDTELNPRTGIAGIGVTHTGWGTAGTPGFLGSDTYPAVVILRNKTNPSQIFRQKVDLKVNQGTGTFKLEGWVFNGNKSTAVSSGEWYALVVTAGLQGQVINENTVQGQAFVDQIETKNGSPVLFPIPYASTWVKVSLNTQRTQAQAKGLKLRPYGVVFQVKVSNQTGQKPVVLNNLGATSNAIAQRGEFSLAPADLPAIGSTDFPKWKISSYLNSSYITASEGIVYFNPATGAIAPRNLYTRDVETYYMALPLGNSLGRSDSFLKLGIQVNNPQDGHYKKFWEGSGNNLRGKIIPVTAVLKPESLQ